ncbi:MAG: V-type ATPase subunit [Clostridia bacterium]|nr:V-type ATPase subunit [Clostridia bacterium]
MKKLQPTEYMYASARIRSLENRIVGREKLETLIEARSTEDAMARLAEYGITPIDVETYGSSVSVGEAQSRAREAMLLSLLREAFSEAEQAVPDPSVFRYLRYPYDCNNIKAAIKCEICGISPEDMLFDFGTVPADQVVTLLREGKYAAFPAALAAAIPVAREAYDKTADPRRIDTVLDRACYEDMSQAATAEDTLAAWLKVKIDTTNLLTTLRILRMNTGATGASFLEDALLPGGALDVGFFTKAYEEGEAYLWDSLSPTAYYRLAQVEGDPRPLSAVEKACDDLYMERVREGARIPFGAPVVGGYLIGCETAVKNVRIILAAKDAGLGSAVVRERVRVSYV